MYLIKNAEVYAPERLGKQDILVISGRIVQVARDIDVRLEGLEVVDAAGRIAVPASWTPTSTSSAAAGRAASTPARRSSRSPTPSGAA